MIYDILVEKCIVYFVRWLFVYFGILGKGEVLDSRSCFGKVI